jgi:exodeoxyribonuclease-3
MRIATWNVNGLRARLPFVLEWLRDRRPDVVGLQELKLTDDLFPRDALVAEGYHAAVHGQKSWNGVAVLAREPLEATQVGLPGQEDLGARLVSVETGGLSFTTIYAPNGKSVGHADYPRKLAWFDALLAHLERSHDPRRPTVLCGDFNVCPTALDSWNEDLLAGTIFHTDDERARVAALARWGLGDLYRALHPDVRAFSWWDYRGGAFHRKQGLRIDFVLGTGPLAARVRTAEIDRDWRKKRGELTPSDHAPVVAELD